VEEDPWLWVSRCGGARWPLTGEGSAPPQENEGGEEYGK
jgi:hypothetical protein